MQTDTLAEHFREFSNNKYSRIYSILSEFIAEQPEILQTVGTIPLKKSPRTILFAAVHALLLKGIRHPLADFYPSLNGKRQITQENRAILCEEFLDFFKCYQAQLKPYLLKNTQTNEAKRSLALLPAFSEIVRREQQTKLSLIEIGTSAGFLLNADKYGYKLNDMLLGNKVIDVLLTTTWHGKLPENLADEFIIIENKIGIDINPLDIEDEDTRLWLKALIWPEQVERLHIFDLACSVLKENKKHLIIMKGRLENYIEQITSICSASSILCFLSVWVLYQLSAHEKIQINEQVSLLARSTQKKIYFILDDWEITKSNEANNIILREFDHKGDYSDTKVCQTHHHGEWINSYI